MYARGSLICHSNSYPFKERNLFFEKPIKIGRSVARARAATNNAIFDCKVLSRNHAIIWYDSGKFYLKDTKSSNGTFINNRRLSPSGEESATHDVYSGDVVQFGVDVVENNPKAKVTHGCIVATLKLYLASGKEAKENHSNSDSYINITFEDLYKLNQFIQEAGRRESALRIKLEYMQILLEQTKIAALQSWKALVLEDCLLSRLEILESQVIAYSKNFGEDKLRIELVNLLEDKALYQNATKELLQKKVQEISKSIGKVQILKCRLSETEDEMQILHNIIKDNQNELQELTIKYMKVKQTLQDTTDKLNNTKHELKEVLQQAEKDKQEFFKSLEDQKNIERNLKFNIKELISNKINIQKQITALRNYMQIVQNIKNENSMYLEKDFLNPANIIDNILSKWKYLFLDAVNYEILVDNFEQGNQLNSIDNYSKFSKAFCINDNLTRSCHSTTTTLEYNNCKFILPLASSNTLLKSKTILDSKDLIDGSKSKSSLSDIDNSLILDYDNTIEIKKLYENALISNIDENISDNENDNIASIQLILKFQKKNTIIEIKNKLLPKQTKLTLQQVLLLDSFTTNILKPLIVNNLIVSKNSQDFIVQNIMHLSNSLKVSNDNVNYIILQELQDLKNWLTYEPNIIIFDKLKKYQVINDNLQVQELSEQLVILKEKYNATIDEKANIVRKYINLKTQCKDFINTTYMVPIYYVVPIIFALICMILEKIL
ncbi:PREDICTED: sarcolemmal membrane-associated protein [Ceratosolen solmsi marchali]|uniref:Sarcolemmal membrane-associated protein n=1 Tax=Ceratosolen solmsi marchali TaxID=326594 RepID=A0AAJ6YQX7_9HYME|nr:PREDICTED: sarcolemmal membrane-associated protein [Ceratosolen solmsi marchali]